MKVWMMVWSYWPGPQGGAERQCRLICPFLNKYNIRCTVVTAWLSWKSQKAELDGDIAIQRIGYFIPIFTTICSGINYVIRKVSKSDFTNFDERIHKYSFWLGLPFVWFSRLFFMLEFFLYGWLNRKEVDVIHVYETGWLAGLGVLFGKIFKVKVVCREATYPPFPIIGWDVPFFWVLKKVRKKTNLIALNSHVKNEMIAVGCSENQISVIPNAVVLPEGLATPDTSKIVLYVGNFSQGAYLKGFDVIFNSWQIVQQNRPDLKLVMAGGGDSSTWKNLVNELGIDSSVIFKGFVKKPEALYRKAGLMILPSRVEGMSNALLEAMSFGLPVVVSDIPANRAVVENGKSGVLVKVEDEQVLADGIIQMMENPEMRSSYGLRGRNIIEERFQPDAVSRDLVSLYSQLTGLTSPSR